MTGHAGLALVVIALLASTVAASSSSAALLDDRRLVASTVPSGPFPKVMTDPFGRAVLLPRAPKRIVSRALVADELLLDMVPRERIAALTYLIDDPSVSPVAGRVAKEVRRTRGAVEEVLAMSPDLVVVAGYSEGDATGQLIAAGAPVLRLGGYASFADIETDLRRIGDAVGEPQAAEQATSKLRARLESVRARVEGLAPPRVLYLSSGRYTAGEDTLVDECIARAGARNVVRELGVRGTVPLPVERIVALRPEIVLMAANTSEPRLASTRDLPEDIPWELLPAGWRERIYVVPTSWFGTLSHHAVLAVEALADIAHGRTPPPRATVGGSP